MNKSQRLGNINKKGTSTQSSNKKSNVQWRVWVGLIALIFVTLMDWQWVWSILFLFWIIPDISNRVTYFIEPVHRNENPLLYWTIIITWIILSLLSFSTLFFDFNSYM